MGYRREIDGLRAFAIIPVVLHHLGVVSLPGGYLGVDVFFVISGFLITSLLQRELADGTFSLGRFWQRRVRRLFPAAWVMVAVTALVMHFTRFLPDLAGLFTEQSAALFGYANIHFWIQPEGGNYWLMQSEYPPYLHFWSLAIEEQFYLFFPPALWVLWRLPHRWRLTVAGVAVLLGLGGFLWGLNQFPTAIFFLLPGRAWELGLGCWLALRKVPTTDRPSVGVSLSTVGLIMIGVMYLLPGEAGVLGPTAVGAVFGTAMVLAGGTNSVSRLLLENRFMVYVGKISYSLYLWHWTVIAFFLELPQLVDLEFGLVWATAIFIPASMVSYHWIEKPTRARKGPRSAWSWIGAHAALALVLFGTARRPVPDYAAGVFDHPVSHQFYYNGLHRAEAIETTQSFLKYTTTPAQRIPSTAHRDGGIILPGATPYPEVVLIGDSHAVMFAQIIAGLAREKNRTCSLWAINSGKLALKVPPVREKPSRYVTSEEQFQYDVGRVKLLRQWRPKIVFLASASTRHGDFIEKITPLLNLLDEVADHVVFIESPPILDEIGNRQTAQYLAYRGHQSQSDRNLLWPRKPEHQWSHDRGMEKLAQLTAVNPKARLVKINDLFRRDDNVIVARGKTIYYLDDDHLVDAGVSLTRPRFEAVFDELFAAPSEDSSVH